MQSARRVPRRFRPLTASTVILSLAGLLGQACAIEQPISGPVLLTGEWQTIIPPEPLRIGQRHQQSFCLQLGFFRDLDYESGVALASCNGLRHVIEGKAEDSEGTEYVLKIASIGGDHVCLYRAGEPHSGPDFPPDRSMVRLSLRSEPPLQVERVWWLSFDNY